MIIRDFAIYKSQPIKPMSQPVTAVICQTFCAGKKHDHPYIYHLVWCLNNKRLAQDYTLFLMVSTDSSANEVKQRLYSKLLAPTTRDRK